MKKIIAIGGGGPAGLTAAYCLSKHADFCHPVVFEASDMLGGLSRTVPYKGNRIDIGGHRFFSKDARVLALWAELMPVQSAPAKDELMLGRERQGIDYAADPETCDLVMLRRRRISRIYYLRRFFDYPVTLSMNTLRAMGAARTVRAVAGYLASKLNVRPDDNLENFYINRFGKPLYRMFFEDYTEKVWGVHPSGLGADWGAQRVKGLSGMAVVRDMMKKKLGLMDKEKVETSLIGEFMYPKYGPGQLWEATAARAVSRGASLETNASVTEVDIGPDRRVRSITVCRSDGDTEKVPCDAFISSIPVKDLVDIIRGIGIPENVRRIARGLPYRDFITVGLLVPALRIKNATKVETVGGRIPDTWIYVQERDVKLGRIQIFNNWSPYMVADFENTVWIGLEYFCDEGDELWTMNDDSFIDLAKRELESIGIINASDVIDAFRIKIRKAYPAYFGTYNDFGCVRTFLDTIPNLYCVGRNGQHRYNNMDHSMLTAMAAVDAILAGSTDKADIWNVNTEAAYHERTTHGFKETDVH